MLTTKRDEYRKSLLFFRAISHDLRLRILDYLIKVDKGASVTEIYEALKTDQSVMSQHLAILRKQKFVNTSKQGKVISYSVNRTILLGANNISGLIYSGLLEQGVTCIDAREVVS